MKIIGYEGDQRYQPNLIVSIKYSELLKLIGHYYGDSRDTHVLKIGDEIQVSEMFEQLDDLKRNETKAEKMALELEAIAALIRLKDPIKAALEVAKAKRATGKMEGPCQSSKS